MGGQMSRAEKRELIEALAPVKGGLNKDRDPAYYKGKGILDRLKKEYNEIKDKGAAYLTGTNYVGPFNRLDDEYIRTHPPTDKIDEGAMKHDLEYSRIAKLRKAGTPKAEIERLIRVSDDAFLDNIKKHYRTNPRAAIMGYAGIKGKNVVEDVVGLDRNLFVGEGMKGGFHFVLNDDPTSDNLGEATTQIGELTVTIPNMLLMTPEQYISSYDQWRAGVRRQIEELIGPVREEQLMRMESELWEEAEEFFRGVNQEHTARTGSGKAAKKRMMLLKKLVGSGFFGDLFDSAKQFASKAVERVKQTGESVVNVFRGKAPRLDLSPSIRRLLEVVGNRPIVRMFVRRDPIASAIDTALNFISIGSWNSLKTRFGYDTFYHLQLEVIVRVSDSDDTNARFVLQKNEVIDVSPAKPSTDKTEMVEVPMAEGHTINSLLSNAKQTMGENFYYYSAFHNNCQDFVGGLLAASGLLRPDLEAFIKQPVEELVKSIPITDRIARGITDLGGVVDVGLQGKGGLNPSDAFAAQLKKVGVSPSVYLEKAKKKANALGLAGSMLGFSDDEKHKLQIPNEEGKIIRFGAVRYGDSILYTLSKNPDAEKHRRNYLSRATKIKGDWAKDPYSKNSLAIEVLWR